MDMRGAMQVIRYALLAGVTAAALVGLPPATMAAADARMVAMAAGIWDLTQPETSRRCRLTLRTEPQAAALPIGMPAGCRRALPVLASVTGWTAESSGHIGFSDQAGRIVLDFAVASEAASLNARGPGGETYELSTTDKPRMRQLAQAAPPPAKPAATGAAPASAAPAVPPPKAGEIAGRYAIMREGGKDTACMLTLDDKARGPKGTNKALLAPACRDQGIVIFDPVGWQVDRGRLSLTARKGHATHLDWQASGIWLKDPKEGKSLSLKKM